MNEIKKNRQLSARLKASKAFRELDDEVSRIEEQQQVTESQQPIVR
jgi:hypothetical protein